MDNTNFEKELEALFSYVGFADWKVHVDVNHLDRGYTIALSQKLDFFDGRTRNDFERQFIIPVGEKIKNSPYVTDLISGYKKEIEELKAQVEKLKPYETHYSLEYKLRNGEKNG